jgi:PAS domain S-box-containing protein
VQTSKSSAYRYKQRELSHSYEWRCDCGKLLFKGAFFVGVIEIKCTRCKRIVYLQEYVSFSAGEASFMAILRADGLATTVNPGITKVLGYTQEEFVGSSVADFIEEGSAPILEFWLNKVQENGVQGYQLPGATTIANFRHQNGHSTELTLFIKPIELDGRTVLFLVAENSATKLQRRTARLAESLKDKILQSQEAKWDFIINQDGVILQSNTTTVLGYSKKELEELTGKSILSIIKDKSSSKESAILSSLKKGTEFSIKEEFKNADGKYSKQELFFGGDFIEGDSSIYLATFSS